MAEVDIAVVEVPLALQETDPVVQLGSDIVVLVGS